MSSTLLLLAEAALFLLCLFAYLRVRQGLQEIRHERVVWEDIEKGLAEVSYLLDHLKQTSAFLAQDEVEERLTHLEALLQGEEPLELAFVLPHEAEQEAQVSHSVLIGEPGDDVVDLDVPSEEKHLQAVVAQQTIYSPEILIAFPNTRKYETVLQLHESGWDSADIAKHIRLGQEEVQLILSFWQRGRGN